ncbi:glycosyltransferase [Thiohalocapsa marina]|uniref:Glycosyltransferase n=1 Tax=Thiohalocapsa marina TaxID=424902 RepID=A0A5M8FU18_9GAMM|nr:glycosyltransferase [Thiohalocapsa marina]KAA6187308.1 glycosyltransferase [Thiohalocapsa marina]
MDIRRFVHSSFGLSVLCFVRTLAFEGWSGFWRRLYSRSLIDTDASGVLSSTGDRNEDCVKASAEHGETVGVSILLIVTGKVVSSTACIEAVRSQVTQAHFDLFLVQFHNAHLRWSYLPDSTGLNEVPLPEFSIEADLLAHDAPWLSSDVVVLLEDTVVVQPDWLGALVHTFERYERAGVVGCQVLYSNGKMECAPSQDWDCSRGALSSDPRHSRNTFVTDADQICGDVFAVRRELFSGIGSLQAVLTSSLVRCRELIRLARLEGYLVIYQPEAKAVLMNQGLSGNAGLDDRDWLSRGSHSGPDTDIDSGLAEGLLDRIPGRLQVLVVDKYMVRPDRDSGSLRLENILRLLRELECDVTFAALNLEAPEPYVSRLQLLGVQVLCRPFFSSVKKYMEKSGHCFDVVILCRADVASALMSTAKRFCKNAQVVFDTVDLHYLREFRLADLRKDRLSRLLAELRRGQELSLIAQADKTFVVSPAEERLLAREAPLANVRVVSNIHNVYGRRRSFSDRRDLLFIGNFVHPPNVDAVCWFAEEVFPLVLTRRPEIKLLVIGSQAPRKILAQQSSNIEVKGFVPDVVPYFTHCRLSVAPLRYGAGVKGKVNQSLAHGLPVVATSVAAEGMFLEDGVSVLVGDDPARFADQVLRAYSDEALWTQLSDAGLAVMQEHFGFASARRVLAELV